MEVLCTATLADDKSWGRRWMAQNVYNVHELLLCRKGLLTSAFCQRFSNFNVCTHHLGAGRRCSVNSDPVLGRSAVGPESPCLISALAMLMLLGLDHTVNSGHLLHSSKCGPQPRAIGNAREPVSNANTHAPPRPTGSCFNKPPR